MKNKPEGAFAVLMTPFNETGVDLNVYKKQIKRLDGTGVSGYVINGSTAECVKLSAKQKRALTELAADNRDKDKLLISCACEASLANALAVCRHAASAGADAALVCPPYYFKYTPSEIKSFYTELADSSPVPVILYNIPFFTQEIPLSVVFELTEHENIIGTKDSSGNMKRIMHTLDAARGRDFAVLTGTDDMLLPAYFAGCAGSMTALAAIYPEKISGIYRLVSNGEYEKAREIQASLMEELREADSVTFPAGYKRLMEKVSGLKFGGTV